MGVQARQMARFAKRNKMTVKRSGFDGITVGYPPDWGHCVLGVLSNMANTHAGYDIPGVILGLDNKQRRSLEAGFENWDYPELKNRYYKMGQNFARLMGLSI